MDITVFKDSLFVDGVAMVMHLAYCKLVISLGFSRFSLHIVSVLTLRFALSDVAVPSFES